VRMLNVLRDTPVTDLPPEAIVCHDVRNPSQRSEILARKGSRVHAAGVRELLARGVTELHLALPDLDDVSEDAAATRMATAVAGPGVTFEAAHFGQTSLLSTERGLLRVDGDAVDRINRFDGVLLLTAEPDRPVDAGTTLGVVKCAPLFLSEATLASVADVAHADGPIVDVQPFQMRRFALLAPSARLRGGAFEQARAALAGALEWYGSSLNEVIGAEADVASLAAAYQTVRHAGAEFILAAGASGTDPLDVVFEGLRQAGGEVMQMGIPAEPGTACWIGRLGPVPVLGLASCELFGRPGALDLLLPRLLTGATLDRDLMRGLAVGGLLQGPSRIAPYHAPHLSSTERD